MTLASTKGGGVGPEGAPTDDAGDDARVTDDVAPVCVVLLGEHLEAMTKGRFTATPHRVVLPPGNRNVRYSQIAEVLPHPDARVYCRTATAFVPSTAAAVEKEGMDPAVATAVSRVDGSSSSGCMTSKELFLRNSEGVSSVNFE